MTKSPEKPEGYGFAQKFSRGSRALKRFPLLNTLIVGNNVIPKGWQVLDEPADEIQGWTTFDGDPDATSLPIPRLYKKAGVIAVEAAEMRQLRRNPYTFYAVALKFGQTAVVGAFEPGTKFSQALSSGDELVATRIGRGDVTAVPGIFIPQSNEFVAAETARYYARSDIVALPPSIPIA